MRKTGFEEDQSDFNRAFFESWGVLVASRFGRNLSRELGIDTFDVDMGERPQVGVGKYLGRDLFVRYQQQVGGVATLEEDVGRESLETPLPHLSHPGRDRDRGRRQLPQPGSHRGVGILGRDRAFHVACPSTGRPPSASRLKPPARVVYHGDVTLRSLPP